MSDEARTRKPLAAIDVDGVISLFGFRCAEDASARGELHLVDGLPHCIATGAGARLARLAEDFELVWATGWEDRANDHLPYLLGLELDMPVIRFGVAPSAANAHWKVDAIERYAHGRPLAWVDDCFSDECRDWAAARLEPTLLVPTECDRGIEDAHVEAMCGWVRSGYTQPK